MAEKATHFTIRYRPWYRQRWAREYQNVVILVVCLEKSASSDTQGVRPWFACLRGLEGEGTLKPQLPVIYQTRPSGRLAQI